MTDLSRADLKLLCELQRDGRITNLALAERVGMSPSPCLRHVRRLEDDGIITGYTAVIDRKRVGLGILAYVEVKVPQTPNTSIIERFKEAVLNEPSIVSCVITAGQFDFLLKVLAPDMDAYSELAQRVLLKLPGVRDMRTTFALDVIKDSTALPLGLE
ncbi:MAG: Lrp/AsnC family transcriptional regulator [Alphaproteobacteria bacterium]|nr:Lrp/AsnC family transcriptional regulator [Alphaproteobacteria bacterium]MBU0793382.1 Lrp/AsnC family transcriptional regulator [Alphaproteobacteria bacterium]MBU0877027.1 Lrp/AsnC family transcriptional regulator [Alphaproteobacteria bacterium]MBU1768453.1 Lrp/AsnC family transcriptional regulator [Alphaproteobacteria bacterium]